mmetsp:Transcript_4911/g.4859  ORF Transcript_4911/g.4859 Transcript_4911/m.4859 type:complete len:83 (-) Transcript_4911:1468-1716(-)
MTQIESAFFTVDNRCATITTVALLSCINCCRALWTASCEFSSKAEVASSNKIIFGFRRNTRAIAKRWRCPPLMRFPRSPMRV